MNQTQSIARRRGVTFFTIAIFIAALLAVRWVVKTQRAPGSVTVIEAQGMDMNSMKPPPGATPVAAEKASFREMAETQILPATAMAYSDEEVIARIPGRVLWTAYPGDNVIAGQVVVRLEANEYAAQTSQALASASGSGATASAAEDEVNRLRSAHNRYLSDVTAMSASVSKAQADQEAAESEEKQMTEAASSKAYAVNDAEAQLTYAQQDVKRQQTLFDGGAISLDRLQKSQSEAKSAAAKVAAARAEASSASSAALAASKRVESARRAISEAKARLKSSQSQVKESAKTIDEAINQANARKAEARAAKSNAAGASVIGDYRQLRALTNSMVADRFVSPGGIVAAGQRLMMLHVADPIRIQAKAPQQLASQLHVGSQVSIVMGKTTWHGMLSSIFPQADATTRTFTVEAVLRNPDHAILPGAFLSMQVQTSAGQRQVAVRNSAIQTDANGANYVWVVAPGKGPGSVSDWTCTMHPEVSKTGPGKCPICEMPLVPRTRNGSSVATRRAVTVGKSNGEYTGVLSGLQDGETVIWTGFSYLTEGQAVQVTDWDRGGPAEGVKPKEHPVSDSMPGMDMSSTKKAGR